MIHPLRSLLRTVRRRPGRTLIVLALVGLAAGVGVPQLLAAYHLRAATEAGARHRLAEARRHVQACLRTWPDSARAHLLAARLARRSDEPEEAEQHLRECERLEAGRSEAVVLESVLLRAQAGDLSRETESYLTGRMERDPAEAPLIREALGAGCLEAQRASAALRWLDQVLAEQPDNARALFLRGQARERLTRFDSIEDYRRALDLDPENDRVRQRLAEALFTFGRTEAAAREFTALRQRQPANPAARLGLARCYYETGQLDRARELLDDLLAEDPQYLGALRERGRLALELGRGAEAERLLREALAHDASDRDASHLLFQALRQQGKEDEARVQQERNGRLMDDLRRIGEILNREMSERPRDAALQCELGRLYLRYGKDRSGLRWLLAAVQADPGYRPAHQALADYYERAGDASAARRHRQMAGDG
jgi:Tfp pilus assembly protein PilF